MLYVTYDMKLNAKELRDLEEKRAMGEMKNIKRRPIYFILENIYDTYNIGGIFRLADALAVSKIYLCGEIEIPPNNRIKKASIGTYKIVPWTYKKTAADAIKELKFKCQSSNVKSNPKSKIQNNNLTIKQYNNRPIRIIAVEQHKNSVAYNQVDYQLPLALIFGNESFGITPETLKLVDQIVEIPMWGINKSLNVIVSAAIVSYWIVAKL